MGSNSVVLPLKTGARGWGGIQPAASSPSFHCFSAPHSEMNGSSGNKNHEETKKTKRIKNIFVLFVSSWLIFIVMLSWSPGDFKIGQCDTWLPTFTDYVLVSRTAPIIEHYRHDQDEEWILTTVEGLDQNLNIPSII
jgi:hypothetical protein